MKFVFLICIGLISISSVDYAAGFKILGIFPSMAKSHFIVGNALMEGLAKAGNEVTVLSAFTPKEKIANYTHIHVDGIYEELIDTMTNLLDIDGMPITKIIKDVYEIGITISNFTMRHPVTKQFLDSDQEFDVIVLEIFLDESLIGFGHHFKAPVIGFSTFGASKWTTDLVGSPSPLSYVPHSFLSFTDKMNFWQRFGNILMAAFETTYMKFFYEPYQNLIYEESFPGQKPSLDELKKNVSLVLLNSHFTLNYPRPYLPNMIEVGGLHINRVPNPLPTDIKEFLDNAEEGVIFFSMGSGINSTLLPVEKRNAILNTFAKLKQKVMWKWESDSLPGKPENVFTKAWWPQDDILAHRNVKLFITHGGLLGSSEAIYHGVPIVGIPIFGDQKMNMARAERAGYGLTVSYSNLTEESLSWAVNEILNYSKYAENAKVISKRYRDQPKRPLDTAIYWVEYVARHKGATHMHCAGQDLSPLEYHNLDIFLLIVAFDIFVIILIRIFCSKSSKKLPVSDEKKKQKKKFN